MWKQMIFALLQLLILPSVYLEQCEDVRISNVSVTNDKVNWVGSGNLSCLNELGFEVCWSMPSFGVMVCDTSPANSTSLTMTGIEPCAYVTAEVTAHVNTINGSISVSSKVEGFAGPPSILNLKAFGSRNLVQLRWSPLPSFTCFDNVKLWICDDETQEISTCIFHETHRNVTSIDLRGYNFPACRYYYAFIRTANSVETSAATTLQLYIQSQNELINATAANVTHNSADLVYWLYITDYDCTTQAFLICYYEYEFVIPSARCLNLSLDQVSSTGLISFTDLYACTAYLVRMALNDTESASHIRQVNFITQKGTRRVLTRVTATAGTSSVWVLWSTEVRMSCVSSFTVYWRSSSDGTLNSRSFPANTKSYSISVPRRNQTFYIEVAATFLDDSVESLQTEVHFTVGGSSQLTVPIVLIVLPVITLLAFFDVN